MIIRTASLFVPQLTVFNSSTSQKIEMRSSEMLIYRTEKRKTICYNTPPYLIPHSIITCKPKSTTTSNPTETRYYRFQPRCTAHTSLRQISMTSGNSRKVDWVARMIAWNMDHEIGSVIVGVLWNQRNKVLMWVSREALWTLATARVRGGRSYILIREIGSHSLVENRLSP